MKLEAENSTYKVDAAGRVIIPSSIRKRFGIKPGDYMDYYVGEQDGHWLLALIPSKKEVLTNNP